MKKFFAIFLLVLLLPMSSQAAHQPIVSVYYMSWSPHNILNQHQQVRDLPWDRVSVINHAFWRLVPNEDRTEFSIASIEQNLDLRPGGAFDQYAEMHEQFPYVVILLSIGGWTDSRWFSLMASTEEGRASFVASTVEVMHEFPFFGGVNINWEHPGPSRNHEGEGFQSHENEADNYTALLRDMRAGLDAAGLYTHQLTIAAPSSTRCMQNGTITIDIPAIVPYLSQISIMTYDMAGGWSRRALHHSALRPSHGVEGGISAIEAVEFFLAQGVPPEMLSIGSPLYTHGWIVDAENGYEALGQPRIGQPVSPLGAGQRHWHDIMRLKQQPGWELYFDHEAQASFIFNSDTESIHFQHFYSFESTESLQAKLDFILEMSLGGIIVWATAGDAMLPLADFPMITQMAAQLGLYDGDVSIFPVLYAPPAEEPHYVLDIAEEEPEETEEEEDAIPFPTGTLILLLVAVIGAITVGVVYGTIVSLSRRR